jgi:phosphatidylethanolamine/phosphatidyl-N-methylethanolamine N-methyltransferase
MLESSSAQDALPSVANLDGRLVEKLYAQCATFYDQLCGPLLQAGRREAMRELRLRPNQAVLEVGIGTALTAPLYPRDCRVTGIDLSAPMLREACKHVGSPGGRNIQLLQMDASKLAFADQSFDVVYAAYVISVVPDPVAVLQEMRRVCRMGGEIVLLNHFLSRSPFLARAERLLSSMTTAHLGFRTDLDAERLIAQTALRPISMRKVNTPAIWTLIRCRREN